MLDNQKKKVYEIYSILYIMKMLYTHKDFCEFDYYIFKEIVENAQSLFAVFIPIDEGKDFILEYINRRDDWASYLLRSDAIGKKLKEILLFENEEMIFNLLVSVYKSGKKEKKIISLERNGSVNWYYINAFMLISGRIVVVIDRVDELNNIYSELVTSYDRFRIAEEETRVHREKLQKFFTYLQNAIEEERAHIAREVHDELGQIFTAIKMSLSYLLSDQQLKRREIYERVDEIYFLTLRAIESIKKISAELRPSLLDHLGLVPAIEWQAEEFQKYTGIQCELDLVPPPIEIDKKIATGIFRILQEALSNVANHSNASWVYVNLNCSQDLIELSVIDNGIGITHEQIIAQKSYGIIGMNERAISLGGVLEIKGEPNVGTTLRVKIPITIPDGGKK